MIVVENRPSQDHFSKVSIHNFLGLKNIKIGYIEMTRKIYLETFEKCPGSLYFPLLTLWWRCFNLASLLLKLDRNHLGY